jgi:RNA polymerase sigma-70 factor, ECF subfamily
MDATVAGFPGTALIVDVALAREFEACLAGCPKLAYRVALGVLRNSAEAEDVAQEALLRAYRNFPRLRDRERFRGWIARTAWRLALDRIRSTGRREKRELAALQAGVALQCGAGVEEVVASREFHEHVARAMDALPEKLRLVMVLAAIEGYDTREVAVLLEIPEGTVRSRLFHARQQMAESLKWLVKSIPAR